MILVFNDATELQIQSIKRTEDYLTVLVLETVATAEQLREMFSDGEKTKKLTIKDRETTIGTYTGYTMFYRTESYTGGILGVVNYKPNKTPEYEADMIASSVKVTKIQAQSLTDEEALTVQNLYPEWKDVIGQTVKEGYKFNYLGVLYKTIQPNLTIQEQYIPGEGTESLYAVIDETHTGTEDDPIPYDGNMELLEGNYYSQDGVVYRCTRNTEQPVYHALKDLVGLYVEVA